jgi:replicative DNA helicase Mcm
MPLRKRRAFVDKDRIAEFWHFGEGLIEGSMLVADLCRFFTSTEKQIEPMSRATTAGQPQPFHINQEQERKIKEFATNAVDGRFTVFDELPKMIAPYISGNEELKLALSYTLASTPEKPVHMLMIGNPASIKTDLLNEVKGIFPEAILGGPRTTEAGLTINSQNGSPGLLMLANRKIALIDEFDKIQKHEISSAYEALESGKISVNTGKFKGEYPTRFISIAAANPKGGKFYDQPDQIKKQIEDVIPSPLLSRFHLVFLLRKETREKMEDAVTTILTRKEKTSPHWDFLRDYFSFVRQTNSRVQYDFQKENPLVKEMSTFVVDALEKSEKGTICYCLTKRFAEALKRLSISSARLRLSRKVEELDARNAMSLLGAALDTASD